MEPIHVQLLIELSVEVPLVLFSVAVLRCVITKVRTKAYGFATDFFLLYSVQATVDLADYFAYLVIQRLTRYGLLPIFRGFPWPNIFHTSHVYLAMFQRVLHVVIAHNRYAAISSTSFPSEMYKKRQIRRILFASAALPLAMIAHMFADRVEYVESPLPPILRLSHSASWAGMVSIAASTAFTSTTLIACVYFDVRTLWAYKELSGHRRKALQNDICLFAFALLQTFVHLLMTASSTLLTVAALTKNTALSVTVQNNYTVLSDVFFFSAPVCLVLTK